VGNIHTLEMAVEEVGEVVRSDLDWRADLRDEEQCGGAE
jgi:hypothetical protein